MANQLDAEEIKQVLGYIDRIYVYDHKNFNKIYQINSLVWGLLFMVGGILDFVFYSISRGELSALAWGLASIMGMVISLYIFRGNPRSILSEEVKEKSSQMHRIYRTALALTILSWARMTILMILFSWYHLIMPIVAFLIGTSYLNGIIRSGSKLRISKFFNLKYPTYLVPSFAYLSFLINITGHLIAQANGQSFINFMGIIVGASIGTGFILSMIETKQTHK